MRSAIRRFFGLRLRAKRTEAASRKLRVRPTASGWGFFALVFCAFLMSVNFSNNLIFAMTFLLLGIALVGWYFTRANVAGLAAADWRGTPVFAGQNAVYRLSVENGSKNGRLGLLATADECIRGSETHLLGGDCAELSLERPAPKRGRLKPVPSGIRSCFPLGIFQARLSTGLLPECLVYPAPAGVQPFSEPSVGSQAHLAAESGSYTDLRRYAPGDPLSRIHWRAVARFDELYTKAFDGAQGKPALWFRWQDVRAGGEEQKLSQLCRWVLEAHKQNREYGMELPGAKIEPAGGEAHLQRCLALLALYGEAESAA